MDQSIDDVKYITPTCPMHGINTPNCEECIKLNIQALQRQLANLTTKKRATGAGCVLTMKYYDKFKKDTFKVVALFLDKTKRYNGQYTVCAETYEEDRDGTYNGAPNLWQTMTRGIYEEITSDQKNPIKVDMGTQRNPDFRVGITPFWQGTLRTGASRRNFKPNNEMENMEFFTVDSLLGAYAKAINNMGEERAKHATYIVAPISGGPANGNAVRVSNFAIRAVYYCFVVDSTTMKYHR